VCWRGPLVRCVLPHRRWSHIDRTSLVRPLWSLCKPAESWGTAWEPVGWSDVWRYLTSVKGGQSCRCGGGSAVTSLCSPIAAAPPSAGRRAGPAPLAPPTATWRAPRSSEEPHEMTVGRESAVLFLMPASPRRVRRRQPATLPDDGRVCNLAILPREVPREAWDGPAYSCKVQQPIQPSALVT
jgi:hypothetical protein